MRPRNRISRLVSYAAGSVIGVLIGTASAVLLLVDGAITAILGPRRYRGRHRRRTSSSMKDGGR